MQDYRSCSTPRCDTCGMYSCEHKSSITDRVQHTSLADQMISANQVSEAPRVRVATDINTSQEVVCPSCYQKIKHDNYCSECGFALGDHDPFKVISKPIRTLIPPAQLNPKLSDTSTKKEEDIVRIPKDDDMEKCNFCQHDIMVKYLDNHLVMHINNFVAPAKPMQTAQTSSSSSIKISSDTIRKLEKNDIKINAVEKYKYRKIENISATSSSSKDGRFSDFTMTLWLSDKTDVYSHSYVGVYHHQPVSSCERLVIHITYDMVDDYYSMSAKMIKRNSYAQYDFEDYNNVPERLCFDQKELFAEVRSAMLFYKISPTSALKRFLKLMKTCDIDIEHNEKENNRVSCVKTRNTTTLLSALKDKQKTTATENINHMHEAWGEGFCGG